MNFRELRSAIKYIQKECKCTDCNTKYREVDIHTIATTKDEALFELQCNKCGLNTVITMKNQLSIDLEYASKNKISQDDILDMKIFLNKFDGNFKKLFNSK